jgi:DNA-binding NtrC family response regulator
MSSLTDGPFIAHNCAIAPRDLFESEFFGHRKGAFTGANREHVGLLTQADGGVLFLDELETLELVHQAKLLRVLDDGLVRPVGAEKAQQVSVRFLAATNLDPHVMMENKGLREDLYYRLRGFEINIPPLRDRREDIPLLATHFAGEDVSFVPEAMEALSRAPWPGNVRQLRNTIRSARAIATGGRIASRHLNLDTVPRSGAAHAPHGALAGGQGATLSEIERGAIQQTLKDCDGNRTQASQILGIDRSTLRRKMKEFGIEA